MLHCFHTAPFPCCTFLCSNLFMLYFFSCCTLFLYCAISCCTFTSYNVFVLHSSLVALFTCCYFFLLHYCQRCSHDPPQTLKMESFATIIDKAVKYCYKALHLRCSQVPGYASTFSMLSVLHDALFSCCTFLILKNIENEQ